MLCLFTAAFFIEITLISETFSLNDCFIYIGLCKGKLNPNDISYNAHFLYFIKKTLTFILYSRGLITSLGTSYNMSYFLFLNK